MKRKSKKAMRKTKPLAGQMLDLIIGYWVSQLVHVAAKLGLADLLKGGPRSPEDLAKKTGVAPARLRRVLRALASVGVFKEGRDGRFGLTPLAATLRSDRPDSMRSFAAMMVEEYNWTPWGKLLGGVREEVLPFQSVHGMPVFDYLKAHPEDGRVFSESMRSISGTENPAIAAAYDFSRFSVLADVGGAHGHLLAAILGKNPKLRGILFDQPQVLEQAKQAPYVNQRGIAGRVELAPGDFFQAAPRGADAYLMKYILHDWDDDACVKILENCRRAMTTVGRVLVVDNVIPPGNGPHWGKLLDINMLALTGGRERTKEEFGRLFARAGLRLTRVVPTACPLSIVEGVSAG